MKSAYLYVRVCTEEQAKRGHSQREQEELLRTFCDTMISRSKMSSVKTTQPGLWPSSLGETFGSLEKSEK